MVFGQKGTKSPILHQRLDVKHVSLKAVILLPTDPCGNNGHHFWLPIPPGNATGNKVFHSFQSVMAFVIGGNSRVPTPGTWC